MIPRRCLHKILCIITFFFLCNLPVESSTEFYIEQFTTANGLSNNTIRCIMQDSKGRMWFGTSNGLSLYADGAFSSIRPTREESAIGLVDQRITSIVEDSDGLMWITTPNGTSCYDIREDAFVDYESKGIPCMQQPMPPQKEITDRQGRIWRITETDGLYITGTDGSTEHFTTASPNSRLHTNALKCIYLDNEGKIWIGTDNLGVSHLDVMQSDGVEYLLSGESIRMLTYLGNDRIAIGNRNGEVWIYDDLLQEVIGHNRYDHNTYCMLEDHRHNLWRGTKGDGLYLNGRKMEGLPCDAIYSLYETADSTLWIGTFGGGLLSYSYREGRITRSGLTETEGSRHVRRIIGDQKGKVWVATSDGVFVLNNDSCLQVVAHYDQKGRNLISDEVRTLYIDSKERIYLSQAGEGMAICHNGQFGFYVKEDQIVNDMVQCFVEDSKGFLWIATELGISCFNPATRTFTNYFFSCNMLNNVYSENCGIMLADGRLAFGSNNGVIIVKPWVYNGIERVNEINIDDITLNGRHLIPEVRYVVSHWWQSGWFYAIASLLVIAVLIVSILIHRHKRRYDQTIEELNTSNDELAAEKEKMEKDVHLRRQEEQSELEELFVANIERIAEEELSNPDFSADDFAAKMGLGRTIFFRKVKEATGFSPKEYMKLKRIRRAAYLLSTTSLTIAEIALKVGINDPLYLSRVFHSEYNCSPSEWRKKMQHPDTPPATLPDEQ